MTAGICTLANADEIKDSVARSKEADNIEPFLEPRGGLKLTHFTDGKEISSPLHLKVWSVALELALRKQQCWAFAQFTKEEYMGFFKEDIKEDAGENYDTASACIASAIFTSLNMSDQLALGGAARKGANALMKELVFQSSIAGGQMGSSTGELHRKLHQKLTDVEGDLLAYLRDVDEASMELSMKGMEVSETAKILALQEAIHGDKQYESLWLKLRMLDPAKPPKWRDVQEEARQLFAAYASLHKVNEFHSSYFAGSQKFPKLTSAQSKPHAQPKSDFQKGMVCYWCFEEGHTLPNCKSRLAGKPRPQLNKVLNKSTSHISHTTVAEELEKSQSAQGKRRRKKAAKREQENRLEQVQQEEKEKALHAHLVSAKGIQQAFAMKTQLSLCQPSFSSTPEDFIFPELKPLDQVHLAPNKNEQQVESFLVQKDEIQRLDSKIAVPQQASQCWSTCLAILMLSMAVFAGFLLGEHTSYNYLVENIVSVLTACTHYNLMENVVLTLILTSMCSLFMMSWTCCNWPMNQSKKLKMITRLFTLALLACCIWGGMFQNVTLQPEGLGEIGGSVAILLPIFASLTRPFIWPSVWDFMNILGLVIGVLFLAWVLTNALLWALSAGVACWISSSAVLPQWKIFSLPVPSWNFKSISKQNPPAKRSIILCIIILCVYLLLAPAQGTTLAM